jgi:hypothetical protein
MQDNQQTHAYYNNLGITGGPPGSYAGQGFGPGFFSIPTGRKSIPALKVPTQQQQQQQPRKLMRGGLRVKPGSVVRAHPLSGIGSRLRLF